MEADTIGRLLVAAAGFLVVPTVIYLATERAHRGAWLAPSCAREPAGVGAYRAARVPGRPRQGRAPFVVRAAAFTSFALGQMFAPSLLAAIVGMFVYGLGVVAVPGLVVALRLFHVGAALLARGPNAVSFARSTAVGAIALNAVIVVVMSAVVAPLWFPRALRAFPDALIVGGTLAYALVSLAQAGLVLLAARALERADAGLARAVGAASFPAEAPGATRGALR
jgi:hypothetical protein